MGKFGEVLLSLRQIVGQGLPRLSGWTREQKQIIWDKTCEAFQRSGKELPSEMRSMTDSEFKLNLAYDETFCRDTGINYTRFDEYWDSIRAAVALFYHEQ